MHHPLARLPGFLSAGLSILLLAGCNNVAPSSPNQAGSVQKIQVTTSFYPLYFLTSQIAGDKATVYNITPAGAEPHDYAPTPQDLVRLEQSRLIVLLGGGMESWGNNIQEILSPNKAAIIIAGERYMSKEETDPQSEHEHEQEEQHEQDDNEEHHHDGFDPHIWLDPQLYKQIASEIEEALIQQDPSHAADYKRNSIQLQQELDMLHQDFQLGLANCKTRNFITSHTAFTYLAKAYDLQQIPLAGISPEDEPSTQEMVEIIEFAKRNQVQYIFFESLISPKLAETIAQEVGAQTLVLNPIEGLSDEELLQGKTYFTVMRDNLTNLKLALQCR